MGAGPAALALRQARSERRGRPPRSGGGGFTLVEVLLALGLSVVLSAGIYQFWGFTERSAERLSAGGAQMHAARLAARRMINELQEGVSLYYPAPGHRTQAGVGFLNARGEPIVYYMGADQDARGRVLGRALIRANLIDRKAIVLAHGVRHFRATTLPAAPGREPSVVNLDLSLEAAEPSSPTTLSYDLVTSVFLRALEQDVPDAGVVECALPDVEAR